MRKTDRYRKAREYLEQVQQADNQVEKLEMRLENLRMLATDTANHLNARTTAGKADEDRIGRILAEVADTEQQIAAAKEEAEKIRLEVREIVTQIKEPVRQKTIIRHYLENRTLQEIADEICYSLSHTYRVQEMGFAEIETILPEG